MSIQTLSPFHYLRKGEVKETPTTPEIRGSEDLWRDILSYIGDGNIEAAVRTHDTMPRQDYIWHLSAANDILEAAESNDSEYIAAIQQRIIEDAANLTVSRLKSEFLAGLKLDLHHFDDAGFERPAELKDVMLLGRSWDNTDRHPLVAELFVRIVEVINSPTADELADNFYAAHQDSSLTFHQACLNRFARYNDFSISQVNKVATGRGTPESDEQYAGNIPSVDEVIKGARLYVR